MANRLVVGSTVALALLGITTEYARATAQDLCSMERSSRQAAGISEDGPLCRAAQNSQSAVSVASQYDDDDLFQCKVILCMAATDGPDSIAECQDTMDQFKRRVRRGASIPACPLMSADDNGGGRVSHTVDRQGNVTESEQGNQSSDGATQTYVVDAEGLARITGYAQQANQLYGGAVCNDPVTMVDHMGANRVGADGAMPDARLQGGVTNTAYADWANQPAWFRAAHPELAGPEPWDQLIPWFVVFALEGNRSAEASVEIGGMSVLYLSRSRNAWVPLGGGGAYRASACPREGADQNCQHVNPGQGVDGVPVIRNGVAGTNTYGWWNSLQLTDPNDVAAITVSAEARLVGDDISLAHHGLMVGADFQPGDVAVQGPLPEAGNSRIVELGTNWTTVTFTTLTTNVNTYNGGRGVTAEQLQLNAPPCAAASAGGAVAASR